MDKKAKLGSETAKGGFANEKKIAKKFNVWRKDKEAKKWLEIMGYNMKEIEEVKAYILHGHKADIHIQVFVKMKDLMSIENLSIKKANSDADYNQIDKRWVNKYKKMWDIPNNVTHLLKLYTGEINPKTLVNNRKLSKEKYNNLKDKRRFFMNEFSEKAKKDILNFFKKKKILIIADILKGKGDFSADWMLVTKYNKNTNTTSWIIKDINTVMNFFGGEEVKISPKGSLYIGKITIQRKGGDAGRSTANMLQFKIHPCHLFNLTQHTF